MTDPTPAEIEAGENAILALLTAHPGAAHTWSRIVAAVLRAVLPEHDARVEARVRAKVAEEIEAGCTCTETDAWRGHVCDFRRAAAAARAHTTEGDTDG